MPRANRVTLDAISKELNLSPSSVSRALRNDPLIHPETRAQVNIVAARLGYQGRARRGTVNTPAQRTLRVLFAANSLTDVKNGAVMMSYLQGMTAETEAAQVTLNIHALPPSEASHAVPSILNQGSGDVLILSGPHEPNLVATLAQSRPVISIVRSYDGVNHDFISTDDLSGIKQMVQKLAALGHRKLAWIGVEEGSSYSLTRQLGFIEGCLLSGLDIAKQEFLGEIYYAPAETQNKKITHALKKGVTAFVCGADHAAYEVAKILARQKISVPGDISVTGFNYIPEKDVPNLSVTTFDPRFVEMGRIAIRTALWRMEHPSTAPLQITVRGHLVEGNSIGPVSK